MGDIHFGPVTARQYGASGTTASLPDKRVIVRKTDGEDDEQFPPGNKWHIDHEGRLHIVGPNGNVASFQPDAWRSVAYAAVRS